LRIPAILSAGWLMLGALASYFPKQALASLKTDWRQTSLWHCRKRASRALRNRNLKPSIVAFGNFETLRGCIGVERK
jgi:hypothetical protein